MLKNSKVCLIFLLALLTACDSEDNKADSEAALFNQEKIVFSNDYIYKELDHEAFTNPFSGGSGTGAMRYNSADESIVTIDELTGLVELKNEGITTLSVTKAADDKYHSATASYQIEVRNVVSEKIDASIGLNDVKLSFTNHSSELELYRTTDENCIIENYATCDNSELILIPDIGKTSYVDSFVNFNQKGFVFLKSKELTSQPLEISAPSFEKRGQNGLISFNNKLFMIAGLDWSNDEEGRNVYYNDVWTLEDGEWIRALEHAPFSPRSDFSIFVFQNQLWIVGGTIEFEDGGTGASKEIWRTNDGINWHQVASYLPFNIGRQNQAVVFKDKIWVIDHSKQFVYSSSDGESWQLESQTTPFFERTNASLVAFNGKLWLIAGTLWRKNGEWVNKSQNDIWSSENGVDWVLEKEHAEFAVRSAQNVVAFNDKLYLFGGWIQNSEHVYNDVWESSDGVIWAQVMDGTFPISGFISDSRKFTVHDEKLWSHGALNDHHVWVSEDGVEWRTPDSIDVRWQ